MPAVETAALLRDVQLALQEASKRGDEQLLSAAESVLSALVVVLRHPRATVPDALGPHIAALIRKRPS